MTVLNPEQKLATDPFTHAALSASAGTGKTHVLTSRVFRLLLNDVPPETILCLTYTKAAAANMAERIGQRLAAWVRMDSRDLANALDALGEDCGPEARDKARTLFARVLDAPGGVKVQTIHAFAQSLLAAFPAEAEIGPGFQPIEGRAAEELAHRTLADLVASADSGEDRMLIGDIERLSARLGEAGAIKYLRVCARHAEALEALEPADLEEHLRAMFGIPDCDLDSYIAEQCSDRAFDCALLRELAKANRGWTEKTGWPRADAIERWLALDSEQRADQEQLRELLSVFVTDKAGLRKNRPSLPDYDSHAQGLATAIAGLLELQAGCRAAIDMASGLRAGRAYALAYARAKRAAGVADFDDLIGWTRGLLTKPGIGEWVRYKLDQRIDHILVDEAQDTNSDQWEIINRLAEEFFSGSSESEERLRTLLMVGDFKQAIYRFQGTDPAEFERARAAYRGKAEALRAAAGEAAEEGAFTLPFRDLSMHTSFRSAQGVLDAVDSMISVVGYEAMGLPEQPALHRSAAQNRHLAGTVELWPPFVMQESEEQSAETAGKQDEEGWIDLRERRYAEAIARQIQRLIDSREILGSTGKPVTPGDILVLVRSRRALASLIVARLFEAGVAVGGVDRLQLHAPLAVQDLLSTMRFAVQPLDDLNLANLLVSPLIGWSQQQLLDLAAGRGNRALWTALRGDPELAETHEALVTLLNMADYTTPAQFLETVLSGPMGGREKLYSRLTLAARDPIDELLNAALAFERDEIISLDHFLAWFRRGSVEIARDTAQHGDEVRVMTVHGAKGLEAPVVIVADAQINPAEAGVHDDPIVAEVGGAEVPLSRSGKSLPPALAQILAADKAADLREHMRLLYVAMTRAIDRLVVAGLKPARALSPDCWHVKVQEALERLGADSGEDLGWGRSLRFHRSGEGKAPKRTVHSDSVPDARPLPAWAKCQAPIEEQPPRPLAPSTLGKDDSAAPRPTAAMRALAERGTWIHALLERLPEVAPEKRMAAAREWLALPGRATAEAEREAIAEEVCAILSDPRFAAAFAPGSLAEAPLAATLADGRVIAGTVDRLAVSADLVSVVDFKTGKVPASVDKVPSAHFAQMTAYADALKVIFPGRKVRASLIYTAGPSSFDVVA